MFSVGQRLRVVGGRLEGKLVKVVAVGVTDRTPSREDIEKLKMDPETVTVRPVESLVHYILPVKDAQRVLVEPERTPLMRGLKRAA